MMKTCIVLPLILLLSASPALSAFLPLICCCDDGVPGFHFLHEEHAIAGHNRGDDDAHPQVSPHVDDDAENHHDFHRNHDSDAGHKFGVGLTASAGSVSLLPTSCTCSAADLPTSVIVKAGITNFTAYKLASGHLRSVDKVAFERRYSDKLVIGARDLSPPGPHVFLVNRSLLI